MQTRIDRILIDNKIKDTITNTLATNVSDHDTITCRVETKNQYNMKQYNKTPPEIIKYPEFKNRVKKIYEIEKGNGI